MLDLDLFYGKGLKVVDSATRIKKKINLVVNNSKTIDKSSIFGLSSYNKLVYINGNHFPVFTCI